MKTNVYIDAGNLYFGLLRKRPKCKWLDLTAFAKALLPEGHVLSSVKYFTSNIKTFPHDPTDLRNHAAKCIDIPRDLPLRCQLPDIIPVGTHGNTIHRPPAWAKSTPPEC